LEFYWDDITNEFLADGSIAELDDKTSTGIVLEYLQGARIVKALNALFAARIAADPVIGAGRRVAFIASDHQGAKMEAIDLISSIGFAPVDLGGLVSGSRLISAKGLFSVGTWCNAKVHRGEAVLKGICWFGKLLVNLYEAEYPRHLAE